MQALYLLKIGVAETVRYIAVIVGREESTVHRWFHAYKEGGLEALLEEKPRTGRPKKLNVETVAKLQQELRDPEGFKSYEEVRIWSLALGEIQASYTTIYRVVRQELQAKLKVARLPTLPTFKVDRKAAAPSAPQSNQQKLGAIQEWIEQLNQRVKMLKELATQVDEQKKVRYWCQDETRLGLKTIERRKLTLKGVKPKGIRRWKFDYYYIYGLVEPLSGDSFFYEFSHLNTACFQVCLDQFSQQFSQEIHLLQVDNAPSHTAKQLQIPSNIILFFQPPYCPEVNLIERFWLFLKNQISWSLFESLDALKDKIANLLNSVSQKTIQSLTGWNYICEALSLAGL
ncbi:transposase [Chroococcus sp. FPU101]|nr:transposase [Chroococcus sp. FPU101]